MNETAAWHDLIHGLFILIAGPEESQGGGTPAEFYKMRHMRYIIIQ